MRWPWTRPAEACNSEEARRARQQAEAELREARARWPEVTELSRRLREHREQNRFSALIEEAMRRRA
jgi:hypothetical protein